MALTAQDLQKAANVAAAAGLTGVGLALFISQTGTWFAAYGRVSTGNPIMPPSISSASPIGQGATDIAALNAMFAAMVSSTAATATAEAAESTTAANIAAAVAAAVG